MRKAWSKMQRWYLESKVHQYPLTREGLEHTSTLREDLYRQQPPEGEAIPILVQPARIVDDTPEWGEISVAVRILQLAEQEVHRG